MKKMGLIAAMICTVCLTVPFEGTGVSAGMAHGGERLTAQEAIAVARHKALKPGSSFTVLREIIANADTRRVGDEALKQAQAQKIKLFQNGIFADLLRTGGFLIAETDPRTKNLIAMDLVSLGPDGVPDILPYESYRVVKLADAEEVVKDTIDFTRQMYSTPATKAASLTAFYGGRFPRCGGSEECTLFGVPGPLMKLGADPTEVRQVVALYNGFGLLSFRHALSMPVFAASPLIAFREAWRKWRTLRAEFLRNNHMGPDFDFEDLDPANIQTKKQLRERIDVLRRLDTFLEAALKNEANPALVKANLSIATIPLGVDIYTDEGETVYGTGTASLITFYWRRLPAGGFALKGLGESG